MSLVCAWATRISLVRALFLQETGAIVRPPISSGQGRWKYKLTAGAFDGIQGAGTERMCRLAA